MAKPSSESEGPGHAQKPRTDGPRVFETAALAESCAALRAEPAAATRLTQARDLYLGPLTNAWASYRDGFQGAVGTVLQSRAQEREQAAAAFTREIAALEANLHTQIEGLGHERQKAQEDFQAATAESRGFLESVWNKVGAGLDLKKPRVLSDPQSVLEGSPPNPATGGGSTGYQELRLRAQDMPVIGSLSSDPIIRKALSWIVGGAFVLGWIAFRNFGLGLFSAVVVAFLVVGSRVLHRSALERLFLDLSEATVREQHQSAMARGARLSEINQREGALRRASMAEREQKAAARDEALAAVDDGYAPSLEAAARAWRTSVTAAEEVIAALAGLTETSVSESSGLTGPAAALEGPVVAPTLAETLKLRLGEAVLPPLAALAPSVTQALGRVPGGPAGALPGSPVFWDLADKRALVFVEDAATGAKGEMGACALLLRAMAQLPPGKANFTFFDPLGLGRNFGPFLQLADHGDQLISGRVWSDREHMRRKLKDLIEHIETVTQKYLRKEFADIDVYNEKAGEIAEAYRFLVVADFPEAFDEELMRDLGRVIQNGPRCGVFTVLHENRSLAPRHGVDLSPHLPSCTVLARADPELPVFTLMPGEDLGKQPGLLVRPDPMPQDEAINRIVAAFGAGAVTASKVEVPYGRLLAMAKIAEDAWWERTSEQGIEAPLGPTGAKKVQSLRLGAGLAHHALLVGRPGSGKSNLIHVFINNLARLYPPDEVQLYLIDFKKGVEFKAYASARLPHARVIAVESEREFGLSVLQGLDQELKRRGEVFRAAGTAQLSEYRARTGEKLARIVLVVDEFQEFFTHDDRLKSEVLVLLDRLVRQGRAFGIHLVLGTQSLSNAGLPRATQDQMAVRIALQSSDADARLILADDNLAARQLTRPGEAIYNDAAGLIEGNNTFQVALFSEEDRLRALSDVSAAAERLNWSGPAPIVFEGHEPAVLAECEPLRAALKTASAEKAPGRLELWLGEPTALRAPVSATLKRQTLRNLLILSKDEAQGVGVTLAALASVAAQKPPGLQFHIADFTAADEEWADHPERLAAAAPFPVDVVGKRELRATLSALDLEVARRVERSLLGEPPIVLALLGLHRMRDLRPDTEASWSYDENATATPKAADCLTRILRDGPEVGVHTLIWCDSYANLDRTLDRNALNDIALRVSGPLAGAESHRIFDDDAAARIDKPHRMLKFDDDEVGVLTPFRPYALPDAAFLRQLGEALRAATAAPA